MQIFVAILHAIFTHHEGTRTNLAHGAYKISQES
jgi:hypothetical protein